MTKRAKPGGDFCVLVLQAEKTFRKVDELLVRMAPRLCDQVDMPYEGARIIGVLGCYVSPTIRKGWDLSPGVFSRNVRSPEQSGLLLRQSKCGRYARIRLTDRFNNPLTTKRKS